MSKLNLSVSVALVLVSGEDFNDQGDVVNVVSLDRDATLALFEAAMDSAEDNRGNHDSRIRQAIIAAYEAFGSLGIPKDALCMAAANHLTVAAGGSTVDLLNNNKAVSEFIDENSIADEEGLDVSQAFLVRQRKSGISLVTPAFLAKRENDAADKAKAAAKKAAKANKLGCHRMTGSRKGARWFDERSRG